MKEISNRGKKEINEDREKKRIDLNKTIKRSIKSLKKRVENEEKIHKKLKNPKGFVQ